MISNKTNYIPGNSESTNYADNPCVQYLQNWKPIWLMTYPLDLETMPELVRQTYWSAPQYSGQF